MLRRFLALAVCASLLPLAGCLNAQQSANLYAAAVLTCAGAQVAAQAAVAITADVNSGKTTPAKSQADAAKAAAITNDGCAAVSKLGSVIVAANQAGATPAQAAAASPPPVIAAPAPAVKVSLP